MKKWSRVLLLSIISFIMSEWVTAQCSICSKTAQQLGEKPAQALNAGILYLAAAPLAIMSYIGYRWWKSNHEA